MQQDAHEFFNFLVNHINEIILAERHHSTTNKSNSKGSNTNMVNNGSGDSTSSEPTWVHEIFQGILTSETRCLNCETVSTTWIFNIQQRVCYNYRKTYLTTPCSLIILNCTLNKKNLLLL